MNVNTFVAIYMDHSSAQVMRLVNDTIQTETIDCQFNHHEKVKALHKSENIMHNKEQQMQSSYYHAIKEKVKDYVDILLFGTTTAKAELQNILKQDPQFNTVKIVQSHTDKMTENQQHAFIKNHIKTHLV
jgi:hypothetical protein